MPVHREEAKQAIVAFLRALGRDPLTDPELVGTADRVTEAWATDLVDGYDVDIAAMLAAESSPAPSDARALVSVKNLAVSTMCPHHLLPARGTGTVVYLPGSRVTGLGTIARLVDAYAHRLTLQETIGTSVARSLVELLGARGAACKLSLVHSCLASRGERQHTAVVETLAVAGSFDAPGHERDLLLAILAGGA
jgi:GTP cyclohydrolase I